MLITPAWSDVASGAIPMLRHSMFPAGGACRVETQASRPKRAVQNDSKKVPEENLRIFFVFLLGKYNSLWLSSYRIFERDSWPKE